MEELLTSAIIVLYPDGEIESVKIDHRKNHIQYLLSLIMSSDKLRRIVIDNNIKLPENSKFLNESTYEVDVELAREGIIIFHNYALDDETLEGHFITLPSEFSDMQKEVLKSIFKNINIEENHFGIINGDDFDDIEPEKIQNMLYNKTK